MRSNARSSWRAGALLILAALLISLSGACYRKNDYTLTEPHVAGILSLQSVNGSTTLSADGVSRLALVAKISGNTDPGKRDILFTTSAGTLVGGTLDTANGGQVVTAASNGEAPIQLQSSTQIQAAVVTAKVKSVSGVVATLSVQFVAVTPDNEILFVVAPTSAPADGFTLSTFTVTVSPSLAMRTVDFKTTNGSFSPSNSQDVIVPVATDNTATVFLKSPATIGNAQVTATSNNFTRTAAIQFVVVNPDNIILFVAAPPSAPADGFTLSTFTVAVSASLVSRVVEFKTTNGTFSPGNSQDAMVQVLTDNTATVFLKSPGTTGNAQVTATISGFTRSATIQFNAVMPNDIIHFVSTPGKPLPADGATLTPFSVAVSPQLSGLSVTFKASAGTFADNPVSVDVNNRATGHLMSPSTIGNADVSATISSFTADTSAQFTRALPNRITITSVVPQTIAAKDGVSAVVTAKLARDVGSVTPGAVATFTATDVSLKSVGFFSATQVVTTDTSGTITTNFFPTAMAAQGPVTITVTTMAEVNGTVVPVTSTIVVDISGM